jgi:hypothetical protein
LKQANQLHTWVGRYRLGKQAFFSVGPPTAVHADRARTTNRNDRTEPFLSVYVTMLCAARVGSLTVLPTKYGPVKHRLHAPTLGAPSAANDGQSTPLINHWGSTSWLVPSTCRVALWAAAHLH